MSSYVRFLLKSTNHHGVHSPFVYSYLTQCLYLRPRLAKDTIENLILKSVPYFNFNCLELGPYSHLKKQLENGETLKYEEGKKLDLICFEEIAQLSLNNLTSHNTVKNESMLVIPNIHGSKDQFLQWEKLRTETIFTVSIDFYVCGVLFFRKEQEKEHFIIRL